MTAANQGRPLPAAPRFSLRPALLVPVLAVAFAAGVGLLLIAMIGVSVPKAIAAFVEGAFGSPFALFVFTHTRTGPNDASSGGAPGLSRHVCTSPTNDSFGVCSVLPIGVLQHAAYQRRRPFEVSRMQASESTP